MSSLPLLAIMVADQKTGEKMKCKRCDPNKCSNCGTRLQVCECCGATEPCTHCNWGYRRPNQYWYWNQGPYYGGSWTTGTGEYTINSSANTTSNYIQTHVCEPEERTEED